MYELGDAGVWRDEEDEVIEREGADEVQQEPRPQVMFGDLLRLQNDVVREVIRYNS